MTQILNDVFWLDLGIVNCYVIRDEAGLCLIDTGLPRSAPQILQAVAEMGHLTQDITRILLTHADNDHAGGAAACLAASGGVLLAGAQTVDLITRGRSPQHLPRLVQAVSDAFLGYPVVPSEAITLVAPGNMLPILGGLQVIATPGHTLDHLSFYNPAQGILFAGDALNLRGGKLKITPRLITADQDAAQSSVRRLAELEPSVIACGHGAPLADNATEVLAQLARSIPS